MKKVTDYTLNNFNGGKNEIFVTFTYENPMNDMEQLKILNIQNYICYMSKRE